MSEKQYIEREAAKEAIRAKFPSLLDRCEINEVLNALPAAPVREVVICGECKYWDREYCKCRSEDMLVPWSEENLEMYANDYCSYGKRKEAEQDG